MSTKRRVLRRGGKPLRIPPEAVEAFKRMEIARDQCTCPPIDWDGKYWERPDPCPACDEWWTAHKVLHDALDAFPHEWPVFEYPDETCPYPAGCFDAKQWKIDRDGRPQAFELYHTLKKAAAT
jgi:hypothetical protein